MSDEHWVKTLVNSMAAKILAFALVGLLTIAVSVGLFTNKHVNILGIEFNDKDTIQRTVYIKPDTIHISRTDTIVLYKEKSNQQKQVSIKEKTKPIATNTQKIDSGGRGIQNNGINNGIQSNGDINITPEKKLTEQDGKKLLDKISEQKQFYHITTNCLVLTVALNSNAGALIKQIKDFLIKNGYDVTDSQAMYEKSFEGVIVGKDDTNKDCIEVRLGIF